MTGKNRSSKKSKSSNKSDAGSESDSNEIQSLLNDNITTMSSIMDDINLGVSSLEQIENMMKQVSLKKLEVVSKKQMSFLDDADHILQRKYEAATKLSKNTFGPSSPLEIITGHTTTANSSTTVSSVYNNKVPTDIVKFNPTKDNGPAWLSYFETTVTGHNLNPKLYTNCLSLSTSPNTDPWFYIRDNFLNKDISWEKVKEAFLLKYTDHLKESEYRQLVRDFKWDLSWDVEQGRFNFVQLVEKSGDKLEEIHIMEIFINQVPRNVYEKFFTFDPESSYLKQGWDNLMVTLKKAEKLANKLSTTGSSSSSEFSHVAHLAHHSSSSEERSIAPLHKSNVPCKFFFSKSLECSHGEKCEFSHEDVALSKLVNVLYKNNLIKKSSSSGSTGSSSKFNKFKKKKE